MAVSAEAVKDLRERTGAGFMDCKRALEETGGDVEKAVATLREAGLAMGATQWKTVALVVVPAARSGLI
ncbi:MAG: hypothetical protein WCP38_03185, partial [Chloroflexota bacterium]